MLTIVISSEVNVPVRTAYHQWTQFEDFPQFMEGVTQVTQIDAKRLLWKAEIAGKEKEMGSQDRRTNTRQAPCLDESRREP
jgi:uncharacterized membrane protein